MGWGRVGGWEVAWAVAKGGGAKEGGAKGGGVEEGYKQYTS